MPIPMLWSGKGERCCGQRRRRQGGRQVPHRRGHPRRQISFARSGSDERLILGAAKRGKEQEQEDEGLHGTATIRQ